MTFVVGTALSLALCAVSAEPTKETGKSPASVDPAAFAEKFRNMTPEQREAHKAKMAKLLYAQTGGKVRKAGSGKGLVLVVDAQDKVPQESLMAPLAFMEKRLRLPVAIRKATLDGFPTRAKVQKSGGTIAVFVVDMKTNEDAILVSPESRWAIVNVAALAKDEPKADILAKRVQVEISRAFGYLCGSANAQYPGSVMGPVSALAELDAFSGCSLPAEQFQRIITTMKEVGVEPFVETSYRKACQEGWAPDPQDETQKAIWDEVHQVPTKPITIKYDEKKGE